MKTVVSSKTEHISAYRRHSSPCFSFQHCKKPASLCTKCAINRNIWSLFCRNHLLKLILIVGRMRMRVIVKTKAVEEEEEEQEVLIR